MVSLAMILSVRILLPQLVLAYAVVSEHGKDDPWKITRFASSGG
jgi:hypothetical protein